MEGFDFRKLLPNQHTELSKDLLNEELNKKLELVAGSGVLTKGYLPDLIETQNEETKTIVEVQGFHQFGKDNAKSIVNKYEKIYKTYTPDEFILISFARISKIIKSDLEHELNIVAAVEIKILDLSWLEVTLSKYPEIQKKWNLFPISKPRTISDKSNPKHALSIKEDDDLLISNGYSNQGVIGYILENSEGNDGIPLYQVRLRTGNRSEHDYLAYLHEEKEHLQSESFATSEKSVMGYVITSWKSGRIKLTRYYREDNPTEFDHFYCTNPTGLHEDFRYKEENINGFESAYLFAKKSRRTIPLYVYSTSPETKLFTPLSNTISYTRNDPNPLTKALDSKNLKSEIEGKFKSNSKFWFLNDREGWNDHESDSFFLMIYQKGGFKISSGEFVLCYSNRTQSLVSLAEVKSYHDEDKHLSLTLKYKINPPITIQRLSEIESFKKDSFGLLLEEFHEIPKELFQEIINTTELGNPPVTFFDKPGEDIANVDFDGTENPNDNIPFHLDNVEVTDRLNRKSVAKSLARLLNRNIFNKEDKIQRAFMVHLQGAWGDGKSTFLKLLSEELKTEDNGWVVVEFNAWKNQHLQPPWFTFIDTMYNGIHPQMFDKFKIRFWWREKFRRILWYSSFKSILLLVVSLTFLTLLLIYIPSLFDTAKGAVLGSVPNATNFGIIRDSIIGVGSIFGLVFTFSKFISTPFFLNTTESAKSFMENAKDPLNKVKLHFESMVKNVHTSGKQLAVYIDDLDRCNATFTVQLLEGIQTLFTDKKILYVVAGDRQWISTCFENHYRDYKDIVQQPGQKLGYLFLEKAFQLSLRLPKVSGEVKKDYWQFILNIKSQDQSEKPKEISKDERKGMIQDFKTSVPSGESITPEKKQEFKEKYALEDNQASDLIVEALDEDQEDIKHILQDHHELIDANPRSIKRLANQYNIHRNILIIEDREFNKDKLFRWLMLQNKYPLFTDWIEHNLHNLTTEFKLPQEFENMKSDRFWLKLMNDEGETKGGKLEIGDIAVFVGSETPLD